MPVLLKKCALILHSLIEADFSKKKQDFLVAQWIRIRLLARRTQVPSLVWEGSTGN